MNDDFWDTLSETICASDDTEAAKAFEKIVRCVNAREQSSIRMREKLQRAHFSEESIESALKKAQKSDLINDVRYAECLVLSAFSQGKDVRFILPEIEKLGINPNDLEAYQKFKELTEDDRIERAVQVLRSYHCRAKNIVASCQRKLISKGYSYEIARKATYKYLADQE